MVKIIAMELGGHTPEQLEDSESGESVELTTEAKEALIDEMVLSAALELQQEFHEKVALLQEKLRHEVAQLEDNATLQEINAMGRSHGQQVTLVDPDNSGGISSFEQEMLTYVGQVMSVQEAGSEKMKVSAAYLTGLICGIRNAAELCDDEQSTSSESDDC